MAEGLSLQASEAPACLFRLFRRGPVWVEVNTSSNHGEFSGFQPIRLDPNSSLLDCFCDISRALEDNVHMHTQIVSRHLTNRAV